MVNVSTYVDNNTPFLRVDDVKNIKGDLKQRTVTVNGEAYFKKYVNKKDETKTDTRLIVPVNLQGKDYLINVNKIANERLIGILGPETSDWVGARLALMIAGTNMPYILLDVVEKPPGGIFSA